MANAPIVHFEIHASDPDRLVDFYTTVFGWTFTKFGGDDVAQGDPYWVVRTLGEGQDPGVPAVGGGLTLRRGDPPAEGAPINGAVLVAGTDDVDALYAAALEHGASVAVPLADVPGVGRLGYIRDPDGNVIGMITPDMENMP